MQHVHVVLYYQYIQWNEHHYSVLVGLGHGRHGMKPCSCRVFLRAWPRVLPCTTVASNPPYPVPVPVPANQTIPVPVRSTPPTISQSSNLPPSLNHHHHPPHHLNHHLHHQTLHLKHTSHTSVFSTIFISHKALQSASQTYPRWAILVRSTPVHTPHQRTTTQTELPMSAVQRLGINANLVLQHYDVQLPPPVSWVLPQ